MTASITITAGAQSIQPSLRSALARSVTGLRERPVVVGGGLGGGDRAHRRAFESRASLMALVSCLTVASFG